MQPLIVTQSKFTPFSIPLIKPFSFAGNTLTERVGFYLELTASNGMTARGEIAPLPGMSTETLKKAKHDLEEILLNLSGRAIPLDLADLIKSIKEDKYLLASCSSVRFGVESALFLLAAQARSLSLNEFLGASIDDYSSAALLQGTHEQIIEQAHKMLELGYSVFKLKVGDRNIPLDVKKVEDLRKLIGRENLIRLDGNRVWSLSEALLFAQLAGREQIDFIEEPLGDMARIGEFYQSSHMPVALDETLNIVRCGVTAPGRCSPTLAASDAVKVYVIKPSVLGGLVVALDWMEEARRLGKRAIISSVFETSVGLEVLRTLACLTKEPAGMGTESWLRENA